MSLILSNTAFCALCASALWVHIKTCSLLTPVISFKAKSFIISVIFLAIYKLIFQFSVICFVFALCGLNLQSAYPLLGRLLTFLLGLQYCMDNMVSLWCSLNISPNVQNSPCTVLHASFSKLVNVCINFSPSIFTQLFIIETFSYLVNSYVLA